MKKLKVDYSGFWKGFEKKNNFFHHLLSRHFRIESPGPWKKPDICFHSLFHSKKRPQVKPVNGNSMINIFYTGENRLPATNNYHLIISTIRAPLDNLLYLPNWVLSIDWFGTMEHSPTLETRRFGRPVKPEELYMSGKINSKSGSCSIVFKNDHYLRNRAIAEVSKYCECVVYGPGVHLQKKMDALEPSTFNICFENSIGNGYVTEKLIEAKVCGCVPLYYGYPLDPGVYNTDCCINLYDHALQFQEAFFNRNTVHEITHTTLLKINPEHLLEQFEDSFINRIRELL